MRIRITDVPGSLLSGSVCWVVLFLCAAGQSPLRAQQVLGAITGTVKDSTGAAGPRRHGQGRQRRHQPDGFRKDAGQWVLPGSESSGRHLSAHLHQGRIRNRNAHRGSGECGPHDHRRWQPASGRGQHHGRSDRHAADEPGGHDQRLRGGSADHSGYAARNRQLHATGDSEPRACMRISWAAPGATPASATRRFSPTASATPATAFR